MTYGVLDAPEKDKMWNSVTRNEFEETAGKPASSRTTSAGQKVCLYKYVDGDARVVGSYHGSFSEMRKVDLSVSVFYLGIFEPLAVPAVMLQRSEATRQIYVIYDSSDHIQAICRYSMQMNALCLSELSPEEESTLELHDGNWQSNE